MIVLLTEGYLPTGKKNIFKLHLPELMKTLPEAQFLPLGE